MTASEATIGVEFRFIVARITDDAQERPWPVTTLRRGKIRLTPVIEAGRRYGGYQAPDTFKNWEMLLTVPWYRSPFLARIFRRKPAFEMWTEGSQMGFVHWLFPYTTWRRSGWRTFRGVTQDGPGVVPDDIPDGMPVTSGAFWKVDSHP